MKKGHTLIFVLYILFGIYLFNSALSFISLPDFFVKVDKWIFIFAGLFLIFGGFNFFRLRRYRGY